MEYGLVIVWIALYVGLGTLAMPATSLVFASLTDRGAGLAIPFAFGLLAIVGYWIGQVRFGLLTALLAVLVLGTLSVIALRQGVELHWNRYRDAVVVFVLAYLFLLGIRAFKPGVWPGGGEKFLDFGLLASLLRSTQLPPQDVWFANEPVRYYYGGHMLAALFALVTNTAAKYAYNLAIAGYYAAFVTAAYGLAGTIAAGRERSYRLGGAMAAFFVAIASNLSTPLRLLIWVLPGEVGQRFAHLVGLDMQGLATGPTNFNYWFASRIIDYKVFGGDQWHLINEFPFFGFLNGDLHGHMMSPVFLLLGAGLAYSYWRTPSHRRRRRWLLLFGTIPPVAGLLLIVNTWSYPAMVGIAWLTLLFAPSPSWELFPDGIAAIFERRFSDTWWGKEVGRLVTATVFAIAIGVVGAVVVLPFVLGPASGRGIGYLPTPRSDLQGLLVVHGTFLTISTAYLVASAKRERWWRPVGLWAILLVATWLVRATAIALFGPLLVGGWYLLRTREEVDFETLLLVGVLGLGLLIEFVYVMEKAGPGRSNTVFKIYAQIWALWSVAAGAMVPRIVDFDGAWDTISSAFKQRVGRFTKNIRNSATAESDQNRPSETPTRRQIGALLLVFLVISLSIYAVFSLSWVVHTGRDEPTLNSHQYITDRHPEEAAAIEWLNSRSGQPTMVSAPGESIYQWVNGPSSMTGIPTVVGWAHEIGYRGDTAYRSRVRDVNIVFETSEAQSRAVLLKKYDVEYIYVGPIERERYETIQYDREPGIQVAYQDESVTIYRVHESVLGD